MATDQTTKVKLKLMIDKRANKVLFAEAENDFADILLNLLYLPFGSIISFLQDTSTVGSIATLYRNLENLSESSLITDHKKSELLKPLSQWGKSSLLLQPQACPRPVEKSLYSCNNCHGHVTHTYKTKCPGSYCGRSMINVVSKLDRVSEGGIVRQSFAYVVTDNLSLKPASSVSSINILRNKSTDVSDLEDRTVEIGPDEVVELLKALMETDEALTTVFLKPKMAFELV